MESFPQRAFQMMHRVLPEVSTEQSTREPAVWVNHGATLQEPKDTYNSTKNNNSMPPPLTYYSRVDTIVTCILIVLIVLLCVNLLALIYKPTRQWILNKYRSHPRIQSQRRQRRYNTIDQWIVRKHVQPHDGVCTALQSSHDVTRMNHWQVCQKLELKCTKTKCQSTTIDMSGEISSSCSSSSSSSSGDDRLASTRGSDADHNDDEDKLTCSICLERFRVQDQVAWSPNPRCNHVYHHACIRDWLLRKTDCPYCRETVLPIDKAMQARQQQETDSDGNRSVALTSPNQSFDNDDGDIENPPNNNHDDAAAAAAAAHAHAHAHAAAPAVEAAAAPASTITDQIQSPTATTSNDKPQPPSTPASLTRQEHHLECSRQRTKRIKTTFVCVECGLVDLAAAPASAVCHDKL